VFTYTRGDLPRPQGRLPSRRVSLRIQIQITPDTMIQLLFCKRKLYVFHQTAEYL